MIAFLLLACVTTSTTPPTTPVEAPATEPGPTPVAPVETTPTAVVDGEAVESAVPSPVMAVARTVTSSASCACDADLKALCPGITAKLDRVACLQASPATSGACLDSLAYAQALNDAVIASCSAYKAAYCAGIGPNPRSGTSSGSNTSEPLFDCYRSHSAEITANGGAKCVSDLAAHDANQEATKGCGKG